jgi:PiT family inorganic phosphate transporter
MAAILLLLFKAVIKDKRLYEAPVGNEPPPFWIRALLDSPARASAFHGSNDGQKGHGPDHADSGRHGADGLRAEPRRHAGADGGLSGVSAQTEQVVSKYVNPNALVASCARRADELHPHQRVQRRHDAGAAPVHQRHRQRSEGITDC